jgi:predicted nucleic acid-binding protein
LAVSRAGAVEAFLGRHRRIGLDTSVFIFLIEGNPRYLELVRPIFLWLQGPSGAGVTSTITMLEVLVEPYRAGDRERVDDFYALLSTFPHLDWIAPSLEIADQAARLRAELRLSAPDAIQAATALLGGAGGFVSNDLAFRRWKELDVLILDELT